MADLWFYAEGLQKRGPMPVSELLPLLARIADWQRVLVWREGLESWKPVAEVREIAEQLLRPQPPDPAPPAIDTVREPAVPAKTLRPSRTSSPR
ncbi:DUF4339 domain-containing protein [Bradyrhizobium sp. Y36]|uniref:DUF4339 domain-containing protein n=1 Tax=Bradyrhizobium sp. Y36 TaxID=2035447 RepID=UPI001FDFE911|nr:DUF4339 domain-containing protein [Bradyrhizobium sp. Y36]